jgi:catechol 2,3-dioxygenase-like lactoylglutathione lyase family enzyme
MAIVQLDHINIRTADLAATEAFFIDVLGLTKGWRPEVSVDGAWLYVGDQAMVHLVKADQPPLPSRGSALDHFAFAIDDYDDAVRKLEAHGIAFRSSGLPGGVRQLFITELNGVTFELNCRKA